MKRTTILLSVAALLMIGTQIIAQTKRPNIIYILADDLGYGDLGCYGQRLIETPNLDTLASLGVRFTNHYAGNTVCAPSRGCLLTGLHSGHSPIRANRERFPEGQFPLPDIKQTAIDRNPIVKHFVSIQLRSMSVGLIARLPLLRY